jgi:hypothetical protein
MPSEKYVVQDPTVSTETIETQDMSTVLRRNTVYRPPRSWRT